MSYTTTVEAERLRIARELHDIVAYSLATISVQAGVAAHVVEKRPDQAAKALGAIKEISGEATRELRTVLGLMRTAKDPGSPRRGIDGLQALADTMTRAGLPTRVTVTGPRLPLAPAVDHAAYSITREALTNALRHAGPATASVSIAHEADQLVLEIVDDGRGGIPGAGDDGRGPIPAGGFGIRGMCERAAAVGGELEAGPRPLGGFCVRARLPIGGQS
jgi:signal transduction histidine kinase